MRLALCYLRKCFEFSFPSKDLFPTILIFELLRSDDSPLVALNFICNIDLISKHPLCLICKYVRLDSQQVLLSIYGITLLLINIIYIRATHKTATTITKNILYISNI